MLRYLFLLTLAILACAGPALGQAPAFSDSRNIPETPAYRRAQEVAGLIKDQNPAKWREYIQQAFAPGFRDGHPMEVHLAYYGEILDQSEGQIEVRAARTYDPPRPAHHAVLVVRNAFTETWEAIIVEIEEAEPHRITSLAYNPARPPADQPKGERLTPEQVAEELGAYADKLAAAGAFSGTVILAKDGKPLLSKAVGVANRDFNVPNTLDTRFNLGSMNKMFTGVAALKLVGAGKLSLDDPIGKYLDGSWCSDEIREKVRVKHLLTHTSGLGSYFNDTFDKSSRALFRRVDDYKPLVRDEKLAFEPGSRWSYSNTGMLLAGAVIEKAAGMDYFEFIRQNITGPAGMTGTDCYELDKVNPNLAVGYAKERTSVGVEYRNNIFIHVLRGGPAGGGYSTAPDLLRFDQALRSGKLLSQSQLDQLWSPHPEVGSSTYGYGFFVETTPVGRMVGHSGGFTGISAYLDMYLEDGYTLAAMANLGGSASLIHLKARELIVRGR